MSKRKILPAVFFQRELNGPAKAASDKPERLARFEEELALVSGGRRVVWTQFGSETCSVINCVCQLDDSCD
jgi:hypothetical protein